MVGLGLGVGVSNACGGDVTTVDATTTDGFAFIQDQPSTGTCAWEASAAGLYQSSNTWGNCVPLPRAGSNPAG